MVAGRFGEMFVSGLMGKTTGDFCGLNSLQEMRIPNWFKVNFKFQFMALSTLNLNVEI